MPELDLRGIIPAIVTPSSTRASCSARKARCWGFSTLFTREQVALLDAVRHCDYPQALALSRRLQPLADVVFAPPVTGYRARTKEVLVMPGVLEGAAVRPSLLPIAAAERAGWVSQPG